MPPTGPVDPSPTAAPQPASELEIRVAELTEELRRANERLAHELEERQRAEAARRASEERYHQIFENAGEAIYVLQANGDRAGAILEANAAAAEMLGYTVAELERMTESDVDAYGLMNGSLGTLRRIGHGEWVEGETVHVRKDGSRLHVEFSAGPLDVGGERFVVKFVRDATERKRGEEALRRAGEAAEAANRAKSAFLANMSHEIRTPMNAILGYAQLLQESPRLAPELRPHLEVIQRSGEHLLELIDEVLEMSRIELGNRKVSRAAIDLGRLLDDLERTFRAHAASKGLGFETYRVTALPSHVVTDGAKLRQVLVNLLGNAVKFTERGRVAVRVEARVGDAGAARLLVEVEDTGPGIAGEHVNELFRPFAQPIAGIHARGGTGLGLALSREFARLMGGDLAVESRVGHGSVFRLEIPVEIGAAPKGEHATTRVAGVVETDAALPPLRASEAPDPIVMRRDHLSKLPDAWATDVRSAARAADYDRLLELLAQIPEEHAALAEVLRDLVERYGYEQIEAMLQG